MNTPDPRLEKEQVKTEQAEHTAQPVSAVADTQEGTSPLIIINGPAAAIGIISGEDGPTAVFTAESDKKVPVWKRYPNLFRFISAVSTVLLTLLAAFIMSRFPEWISDSYVKFSRVAQHIIGSVFGIFSFSVVEFLIGVIIVGVPVAIVAFIVLTKKRGGGKRRAASWLSHTAEVAAVLLAVFIITWGVNYRSAGLAYSLKLDVHSRPAETLAAALEEITLDLRETEASLPKGDDGRVVWPSYLEMNRISREAWVSLAEQEPYFEGIAPTNVKPVKNSRILSYMGITGVFTAFTGEANVNTDFPDSGRIFTMCHELAHSFGCAPENEANFAAYLACLSSDSPYARYSGLLAAFSYCYNALLKVDAESAYDCWYLLPEGTVAEYRYRSAYWQRFEGEVQKVATAVNDSYLKTMGSPQGVQSYGAVVDLILADFVSRNLE